MRAVRLFPVLLVAGCGVQYTPRSVVENTRVLAIVATPLEVGPNDSVTLTAYPFGPADRQVVAESWSFCPFSAGSTVGYECAVPQCELELSRSSTARPYGASAPLTATPGALAQQCVALLSGSGSLPPGVPAELPEQIEVLFKYRVTGSDGVSREAVQRVPLYPAGAPADPNVAPGIGSVSIGGPANVVWESGATTGLTPALRSGETLDVEVLLTDGSAQTYVEGGRTLTEQLVVSFYTTAGRFDYDWANGPDATVKLKGEDLVAGTASADVWVVARDLRGGETVAGPIPLSVLP